MEKETSAVGFTDNNREELLHDSEESALHPSIGRYLDAEREGKFKSTLPILTTESITRVHGDYTYGITKGEFQSFKLLRRFDELLSKKKDTVENYDDFFETVYDSLLEKSYTYDIPRANWATYGFFFVSDVFAEQEKIQAIEYAREGGGMPQTRYNDGLAEVIQDIDSVRKSMEVITPDKREAESIARRLGRGVDRQPYLQEYYNYAYTNSAIPYEMLVGLDVGLKFHDIWLSEMISPIDNRNVSFSLGRSLEELKLPPSA